MTFEQMNEPTPRGAVERATRDPRWVVLLVIGLISVLLLAALAWGRRSPSRTAEAVLLELAREAFDRSADALEATVAKLGSAFER